MPDSSPADREMADAAVERHRSGRVGSLETLTAEIEGVALALDAGTPAPVCAGVLRAIAEQLFVHAARAQVRAVHDRITN